MSIYKNPTLFLCGVLSLLIQVGCATSPIVHTPIDQIKGYPAVHQQESYKLGIGDELEFKFFFAPELNDRQAVSPDGTISIMFAPRIQAAGLTINQLTEELKLVLEDHVKQMDMVIVVRTYASQRAYVAGEVAKPGVVQLNGVETVMQVLADAGWITLNAGNESIVLVRRDKEDPKKENVYPVNLSKILDATDLSQNVVVEAGDIIMVPPSSAVSADRWVDQNIRQLLPFSTSAGMSYNINPVTR